LQRILRGHQTGCVTGCTTASLPTPVLADLELARAQHYFEKIADALRLPLVLDIRSGDIGEDHAQISRDGPTTYTIELGKEFWRSSVEEKRDTAVHELCHCVTWALSSLVPDTYSIREDTEHEIIEFLVAWIAPQMPLWDEV